MVTNVIIIRFFVGFCIKVAKRSCRGTKDCKPLISVNNYPHPSTSHVFVSLMCEDKRAVLQLKAPIRQVKTPPLPPVCWRVAKLCTLSEQQWVNVACVCHIFLVVEKSRKTLLEQKPLTISNINKLDQRSKSCCILSTRTGGILEAEQTVGRQCTVHFSFGRPIALLLWSD